MSGEDDAAVEEEEEEERGGRGQDDRDLGELLAALGADEPQHERDGHLERTENRNVYSFAF